MKTLGLQGLFGGECLLREAGGDRPLLLREGRAWLVRSGRIDVFAVELRDGEPAGPRTHLFRVEAGGPLLGVGAHPEHATALLAVGTTGTVLAELDAGYLRALGGHAEFHAPLLDLLHVWAVSLYGGITASGRPRAHRDLEPGGDLALEAGTCARPTAKVAWVEQAEGTSRLLGRAECVLREGEVVPVAREGWVEGEGASRVRVLDPAVLFAGEGPWPALERLHRCVLDTVAGQVREAAAEQRERLRRQRGASRDMMSAALARLAAAMRPGAARSGVRLRLREDGRGEEDTLFAAFRMVAGAQGIEARQPPEHAGGGRPRDPLDALARAHRLRTRRVALRDQWWRRENGPLLALTAGERRPVAILPRPRGGYDLCDPHSRTQRPVDAEAAATLEPFGYTLYRPFPAEPLRVWPVLRFGLRGCGRDLLTVAGLAGAMGVLASMTPLAVGVLFDSVIPGAERGELLQLTVLLLTAAVAAAVFQVVRGIALLRIESHAGNAIQAAVWDRLIALPLPFFREYTAGDLAVRAMSVDELRRALSGAVVTGLLGGVLSVFYFALLFWYDGSLALLATGLVAVAVAVSLAMSWLQLRGQREILKLRSRISGVVLQLLAGIAKLKMVAAEPQAFGLWARLFSDQRALQFRARSLRNWLVVFHSAYPVVCSLAIFAAAAPRLTGPDALTTGVFLGFLAAFNLCLASTLSASGAVINVLAALPLYEQAIPILHTVPEVNPARRDPGELAGAVELQHVGFRYQADGPPVLRDISIRARPGEFVALVGPSGSGKSTLLRLLLGFEVPEVGTVSYDEQDLAGLDIEAVRRQMGVVLQSGRLMAGDVFTNIVGASPATLEQAWEAAAMAGLDEDIRQMPMGMHTMVSEGGSTFSGGQRQRLMIARAVVHRPRILLFDEATSALDNRTQAVVTRSLDRLKATRIVVAHRLSTIVGADRIYVLQGGSVVETGRYEDLLARDGVFARMARRQLA